MKALFLFTALTFIATSSASASNFCENILQWDTIKRGQYNKLNPKTPIPTFFNTKFPHMIFGKYEVKYGGNLSCILVKEAKLSEHFLKDKWYLEKLVFYNKHIDDFSNIPRGEKIFFFIPTKSSFEPVRDFEPLLSTGYISSRKREDILSLLASEKHLPYKYLEDKNFIVKTIRNNPQIIDYKKIPPNQKVFITLPYDDYSEERVYKPKPKPVIKPKPKPAPKPRITRRVKKTKKTSDDRSLSLFYMTSIGVYSEKIEDSEISSTQQSPITLGLSYRSKLSDSITFDTSNYLSYLDRGEIDGREEFDIPMEYGLTSYLEFKNLTYKELVVPYMGLDIESFSTVDVTTINKDGDVETIGHQLYYATLGVSASSEMWGRRFLFKSSVSRVISSSVSDNELLKDPFEGYKFILFGAMGLTKKMSLTGLFKMHDLEASTELGISRVGVGLSYKL